MKKLKLIGFTLFCALILTACSEQNNKRESISLGIPASTLTSLIWLADELQLFKKQGLDVKLKVYPSGKEALSGLLAGEVALAATAETPFVIAIFKNKSLRLISTIGQSTDDIRLLARRDHGISQPSDLIGKVIATQYGSAVHFFLSSFLLHHQIPLHEVKINYSRIAALPLSFVNGDVDVISIREPYISQIKNKLDDSKIIEFSVQGLYTKTYNLVGNEQVLKEHSSEVIKLLIALNNAEKFINDNPKKAMDIIARKLLLSTENVKKIWSSMNLSITLNQGLIEALEEEARWAIETKMIPLDTLNIASKLNPALFIDPIYLEKAVPYAVALIR